MRALTLTLCLLPAPALACDVALSLIIDVSGSVNEAEFAQQTAGLADAMLDPTVRDALIEGRVALNLIEWSGGGEQKEVVPWAQITSEAGLLAFTEQVRVVPREWRISITAIGSAMKFAGETFARAPSCERRVIDVSGDGPSNGGKFLPRVRDDLVSRGFIINGIAIESSIINVTDYFKANVIGGYGSFVLTAVDYSDYPRAIRRKLLAEVTKPGS